MMEPRVSVRHLTKVFTRRDARRRTGVSLDGPAAFLQLLRTTLTREADGAERHPRGDRDIRALDDVSFDVEPGEVLGIIGRNGAGKSTLLKILARVLHPTMGRAVIRGRVVSMLELGIGFAPELTVHQNIQIHGRLAGIPAADIDAAEPAILAFAELEEFRDEPLGECPSGSAIQLGFAAALELSADIILADEVLAVGDTRFRAACEERVRRAGGSGQSVLFVSHDMAAIQRICSRVLWIDRGKVVRTGSPSEVVRAYTSELLAGRLLPPLTREGLAASCVILDTRLLDESRAPVGALQLTRPGYLDCLFRIERPDVAVVVEIELWQGRHHVFTTVSQAATARETATFQAGVRIPGHFLNEQRYEARFRLRARSLLDTGDAAVVVGEERLDVPVMNPHPSESVWSNWPWARQGLISPRLSWQVFEGTSIPEFGAGEQDPAAARGAVDA